VSESPEQIRRHIEALSNFEVEYREFISALEEESRTGQRRWSDEEGAERKRAIQKNAVRADKAMKASGVGQWALTHPPAIGGAIKSQDLPSQVFDFQSLSYSDDGLSFQRSILERIPSQIAGLEVKLEEAEAEAPEKARPPRERKLPALLVGRIRHVPPVIGFVADVGGCAVVVLFLGHVVGVW
jgi:hypothetical protein